MAGGTGGHVYPALAVADFLRQRGVVVHWLGTARGLEARLVPVHGYQLTLIDISGLRGKGIVQWIRAPAMVLAAVLKAYFIIRSLRPDAVLGMGGFVSGPGGIAAWLAKVPLYIHEQNSILGLTNRFLARFAVTAMEGFPETFKSRARVLTTGNPVRADLIALPEPEQRLRDREAGRLRLLVIGGSLGARVFNEILPATLGGLDRTVNIEVWHQTGEKNFHDAQAHYTGLKIVKSVRLVAYIEDMAAAYAWADVVLCRAGALTIAELCVVGIASILVPYPYAVDDHQTANARLLSERGGAILLPESEFKESKLTMILTEFARTRDQIIRMARAARALARPDATRVVGEICLGGACA
jgi:UDP-N-acetylglucosamine--N-acetylmuramyl-(pentapeptide) pyrophosphoryl-undecaprenol N-acetylglucosamine transferase